jgi:hypothetical protein
MNHLFGLTGLEWGTDYHSPPLDVDSPMVSDPAVEHEKDKED